MSVGSLLQTELAPPRYRGLMVGLVGVMISFGYVFSNWLGVAFYFVQAGGTQWRIPFAICTAPSLLVICLLPLIPESPRWLVMKDRQSDARAVLAKLHGHHSHEGEEFAELELKQIVAQIAYERENAISWWALFTSRRYRTRLILTIITQSMSQVREMASEPDMVGSICSAADVRNSRPGSSSLPAMARRSTPAWALIQSRSSVSLLVT